MNRKQKAQYSAKIFIGCVLAIVIGSVLQPLIGLVIVHISKRIKTDES